MKLNSQSDQHEIALIIGFLGWCGFLIGARLLWTGRWAFMFLVWNLFLATLPYALSLAIRRRPGVGSLLLLAPLWLAFFPNAPYLLTDLVHLRPRPEAPLWYDMMLLWSAALAGLFLAFTSLRHMQTLVTRTFSGRAGWCFSVAVLFLAAFGVALGRFQRWNSWAILADPLVLAQDILNQVLVPWMHPRTWAMTCGLGVLLTLAYLAIGLLVRRADDGRHPQPQLETSP